MRTSTPPPVHPHGRGERSSSSAMRPAMPGSSPRAWGTQCGRRATTNTGRFIPTGVGNAWAPSPSSAPTAVHPHGRGERDLITPKDLQDRGSSPRAWGTPKNWRGAVGVERFIPTGVGNAPAANVMRRNTSVHPHGRGERPWAVFRWQSTAGSSPRAWGTQAVSNRAALMPRFIPTGVGNARPVR